MIKKTSSNQSCGRDSEYKMVRFSVKSLSMGQIFERLWSRNKMQIQHNFEVIIDIQIWHRWVGGAIFFIQNKTCISSHQENTKLVYSLLSILCFIIYIKKYTPCRPPDNECVSENIFFLFRNQNICCGYSKEPSR